MGEGIHGRRSSATRGRRRDLMGVGLGLILWASGAQSADLRVRWLPIDAATATYRLYCDGVRCGEESPCVPALCDDVPAACCDRVWTVPSPPSLAYLTAVTNDGESAPSNAVVVRNAPAPTTTTLGPVPTTTSTAALATSSSTTTSTSTTSTWATGPPPSALLAAYGFEEPSGTQLVDSSGAGRHGALGGAVRITAGRFGRAIRTTNGIATAPAPGAVRTAMAWMRPASVSTGWRCPLSNWGGGDAWYLCHLGAQAGPGTYLGGTYREAVGGSVGTTWVHLAATFDGTSIRSYVNGAPVRTITSPAPPATVAALLFGQTVSGERFAGDVDEVRCYGHVLSPAEIVADMNQPVVTARSTTTSLPPSTSSTSTTSSTVRPSTTSTSSSSSTSSTNSSTTSSTVMCCRPSAVPCP